MRVPTIKKVAKNRNVQQYEQMFNYMYDIIFVKNHFTDQIISDRLGVSRTTVLRVRQNKLYLLNLSVTKFIKFQQLAFELDKQ